MKQLNFEQMELISGGIDCGRINSGPVQTVLYVCSIGSFFGLAGALIFGPTALALGAASVYCANW